MKNSWEEATWLRIATRFDREEACKTNIYFDATLNNNCMHRKIDKTKVK